MCRQRFGCSTCFGKELVTSSASLASSGCFGRWSMCCWCLKREAGGLGFIGTLSGVVGWVCLEGGC